MAEAAGDFDYETYGGKYTAHRKTDPRIASYVHAALGSARNVINVGAGAGSYEPTDRQVTAVEPSASMRAQRPQHLSVAVNACAEDLPFDDNTFDAAMAMVTVHQWRDPDQGLRELRRVSRGPVAVLTFDGTALERFWLTHYCPELVAHERRRFPAVEHVAGLLGGQTSITPIPIPFDCVDGFTEAYYGRPERFLEADVRRAQSAWGFVAPQEQERAVAQLATDLQSGEWDRRWGPLRTQPEFVGALCLITSLDHVRIGATPGHVGNPIR
jgi:SAM-dependent methyltransferase